MSEIKVNNGNIEDALKRFKRQCARNGVLQEVRKREHYEKPSVRRKKKSEAARKRKFNQKIRTESRGQEGVDQEDRCRKGQHVEGHDQRIEHCGAAFHHPYYVDGIGHDGHPGESQSARGVLVSGIAPRQQGHAHQRDEDGDDDPHRAAFAEKERHDDRHHQRIEEIDGRGHSARDIVVGAQQPQRRGGIHHGQQSQHGGVTARNAEVAVRDERHEAHHRR